MKFIKYFFIEFIINILNDTALNIAVEKGNIEIVKLLLAQKTIDADFTSILIFYI